MNKYYRSKFTKFVLSLQKDLEQGKIDEQQFNFLLGVFIKNEMNNFVKEEISGLLPEENEINHQMMFLSYKKRKLSYA